jgi:signal transduction histidine kinase
VFKIRDISIRNKLILMQVFTSILVLGIFIAVFVVTDIRSYKQRKVDSMISLAQVIGANSISALDFEDNQAAKDMLAELHNVAPEIIHAGIIDKKGEIFASYSKPGADTFRIPSFLGEKKSVFANEGLIVANDIVSDNKVAGKVILEVELSELEQIKQSQYKLAAILLLVAIGFSFVIAIGTHPYISKRLLHLVNTMKEVGKTENYKKSITDDGKDEISTLIHAFNNLMQQVNENQQRKDEFISIASHELKTPLTSIKGYLQLLNEIEDKQPNKQFVQKAWENVNKLEKLIRELLDVSKIQSGQLELTMKEFNIDTLIDETIAAIQMVSGTHMISRQGNFNNEIVSADRQRIEQVLTNLLSNAIKYSPGERKVIVYSEKTAGELIIKVRDFGMGVPKEEQSDIFERFYRSKNMTMTISGFGLGLYICRDIVNRHNGRIWLEAQEKGSAFYFSLPLMNAVATQNFGATRLVETHSQQT